MIYKIYIKIKTKSNYWGGSGGYNNSCLDTLFKKEDLKIEDILDEENIVNDIKNNSSKFSEL
jgi:hypothetical protein